MSLCGTVLYHSLTLTSDLDCTGFKGTVFTLAAPGITLDGAGHRIIAPDAAVVVSVFANGQAVQNIDMSLDAKGSSNSNNIGVNLYRATGVQITNNNIYGRALGIYANEDTLPTNDLVISGNNLAGSTNIALVLTGSNAISDPVVTNNDLSNAASVALLFQGKHLKLTGKDGNVFTGARIGVAGQVGGTLELDSIDLSSVVENPVYAYQLSSLILNGVNVSGPIGSSGNGVVVSEVESAQISGLVAHGRAYGIAAYASGNTDNLSLLSSDFANNGYGILLDYFGNSKYNLVEIRLNTFTGENTTAIYQYPNSIITQLITDNVIN